MAIHNIRVRSVIWLLLEVSFPSFSQNQPDALALKRRKADSGPLAAIRRVDPSQRHFLLRFPAPPEQTEIGKLEGLGIRIRKSVGVVAVARGADSVIGRIEEPYSAYEIRPQSKWSKALESVHWDSEPVQAVVVEFHADVSEVTMRQVLDVEGLRVRESPTLAPNHALVLGTRYDLRKLTEWDEVALVFAASDDLLSKETVYRCDVGSVVLGEVSGAAVAIGDGWDGPGRGTADLTYWQQNTSSQLPQAVVQTQVQRALAEWSRWIAVSFRPANGNRAQRQIDFAFARGDHGDGWPFAGNVIAHAAYPSPPNGEPFAGDVHFNDDIAWAQIDLYSVALHELGHALGLAHSDVPNSVMYPYYSLRTGLTTVDIETARTLYAARGGASSSPPVPVSVSPSQGDGTSQLFRAVFSDSDGVDELGRIQVLFGAEFESGAKCHIVWDYARRAAFLRRPDGSWIGPSTSGLIGNEFCSADVSQIRQQPSYPSGLELFIPIQFSPAFVGRKQVWMYATDAAERTSNWARVGTWNIPGAATGPPLVERVTPSTGTGTLALLTAVFSDPDGAGDLSSTQIHVAADIESRQRCQVAYVPGRHLLFLRAADGYGWSTGVSPGTQMKLGNVWCAIDVAGATVSRTSDSLSISVPMRFTAEFTGAKTIFGMAEDSSGRISGWKQLGRWTIGELRDR